MDKVYYDVEDYGSVSVNGGEITYYDESDKYMQTFMLRLRDSGPMSEGERRQWIFKGRPKYWKNVGINDFKKRKECEMKAVELRDVQRKIRFIFPDHRSCEMLLARSKAEWGHKPKMTLFYYEQGGSDPVHEVTKVEHYNNDSLAHYVRRFIPEQWQHEIDAWDTDIRVERELGVDQVNEQNEGIEEIARYTVEGYGSCSVYPGYVYYYGQDDVEIHNVSIDMGELEHLKEAKGSLLHFCITNCPKEWGSVKKHNFRRHSDFSMSKRKEGLTFDIKTVDEFADLPRGTGQVQETAEYEEIQKREAALQNAFDLLRDVKDTLLDRQKKYGSPEETFKKIAQSWGGTPEDVCIKQIQMKIVRYQNSQGWDDLVDIIGYTCCLAEIHARRSVRENDA